MKLQVAFDVLPLEEALDLARGMEEDVDRFELGTPFLLEHGMEAVRRFRAQFPGKELLADTKIMDAGRLEAESAFRAGADLVTVLAVTDLATVRACVEAADRAGRRVVADMICVSDLSGRARELEEAGIHGIAVHTGVDQQAQGRTPLQDLAVLRRAVQRAELSAAGGILPGEPSRLLCSGARCDRHRRRDPLCPRPGGPGPGHPPGHAGPGWRHLGRAPRMIEESMTAARTAGSRHAFMICQIRQKGSLFHKILQHL